MKWKTRITEMLGCKYPILLGGLTKIGTWDFAAAVSKAGADGCLTAAVSGTPEQLGEDIKKLRDATDNHFTVNVTVGMCPHIDEMLDVCIDARVPCIETAAFKPDDYAERIKASGIPWIHKGATVEFVKHAEKLGADAVVLVGLEGYGFKNIRQLPTMTSIAWASRQVNVPLIAAGGIGDARTLLAALMAGADGVYLGSALMATVECPLPDKIKENMVKARPDHPDLIRELIAPPNPKDFQEIMAKRNEMPLEKWLPSLEKVMLKHHDWKEAKHMWEQDMAEVTSVGDRPRGPFSFSCAYIDSIVTVKEYIDRMVTEAEEIMERMAAQWELGK